MLGGHRVFGWGSLVARDGDGEEGYQIECFVVMLGDFLCAC